MSITEFLRENAGKYPDRKSLIAACIQELNCSPKNVQNAFYDVQKSKNPIRFGSEPVTGPTPVPHPTLSGLSELELRQKHDVKYIIKQAALKLPPPNGKGEGTFVTENEFIKQCNIQSQSGFRLSLAGEEFSAYKGKAGGVTYWAHPESITKMKNEGILR